MKLKLSVSVIAIAAVVGTAAVAADNGTSTFDASVSVLSPDQTGFIIGGQVAVTGLGSGALTMSRSAAEMSVLGGAVSELDPAAGGYLDGVNSGSDITSSLTFDREISTSGSLVGQGSVTARGEAIASMGTAGAASADTATAGTRADGNIAGGEGGIRCLAEHVAVQIEADHVAMGHHPRYHIFPALEAQVAKGHLGRKSGQGFLHPAQPGPVPADAAQIALRIEATLINEAHWLLSEGGTTAEGIDTAMKLGLNFPRGPFEALALHGRDAVLHTLAALHSAAPAALKPRYTPAPGLAL
ncbi:MAG: hypothetical protein RL472_359 [Pseudomonadota bacterium]